jgi:hypothetical protein
VIIWIIYDINFFGSRIKVINFILTEYDKLAYLINLEGLWFNYTSNLDAKITKNQKLRPDPQG